MAKQGSDFLDLLKAEDEPLALTGEVRNLTTSDLRIVDGMGKVRTTYPRREPAAYVEWDKGSGEQFPQLQLQMAAAWRAITIGAFNDGFIDLVKPLNDLTELVQFWKDAVRDRHAVQRGLPDMKALRKQSETYCVATPDVAIVAYFRYEEIDHLLVPARPVRLSGSNWGYRALMPAGYLLCGQSVRR